ncbi:hypothetical protein J7L01_04480, partial [bacterium]|nr:hypothetical protein [bacterium]
MMRIVLLAMLISVAVLAVPGEINYQGKLTDTSGVAFEGVYTITFSIYNVETGGVALWTEAQDVTLVHGLFDVRLGSVAPIPSALDFSEPYWLEISIGGETLSPRQPLTSSPYAFRAAIADSVVGGSTSSGNNLDEAYDASPSGNKRIDADDGAVEIVSGLFNGPLSVTSNSIADAAIYATNAPGGNAIWADENIYANDANIIAKGDVRVEDASGYTAGLVGDSGNFWLHGRIEMNNDRTIFARNSSDALKGIFTPLNGADDVILSMADGNNFYIQDNTYDNVAQFAGGDVALYLFGDLSMDTPTGSGDFDILMNDNSIFNATIVEANTLRDNDDGELTVDDDLRVGNALYIGDVPVDAVAESVLTIDGGQVKKVAASSIGGADADWQIGSGVIYNTSDNVGIGTSSPEEKLHVFGNAVIEDKMAIGSSIDTGNKLSVIENVSSPSLTRHGIRSSLTGLDIDTLCGIRGSVYYSDSSSTSSPIGEYDGVFGSASNLSDTNSVKYLLGLHGQVGATGSAGVDAAENAAALWLEYHFTGTNKATNLYGIRIYEDTHNGSVNNYGLFVSDAYGGTGDNFSIYSVGDNYFGGNVGIGVNPPTQKLDVNGNVKVGDALYIGDVPVDAVAESVLTIDGGQVKKVAASSIGGADADWQIGSGIIYNTSDNVGIGTSSPLARLALDGDGAAHYGVFIEGPSTSTDYQAALYIHSNNFSSDPAGTYNKYYGIYVDQEPTTTGVYKPTAICGNMSDVTAGYSTGVLGRAMGTGADGGRTYGVKGFAGGGSEHYNYAVYGELQGSREGTAVLGYDAIDHSGFDGTLQAGNWAGYFHGNIVTTDRTYFGDSDVYIRQDGSNNMAFRDPNTNGGSEVTLSELYSGGAFIQNQSSIWQDGWFQIQKHITTTQDAIAEIDFSADIAT